MDLDLLKEIQIKDFMDFADRPSLFELDPPKKPEEPINDFLIFLRGTRWKRVRSVITPSFTTLKLKTKRRNDLLLLMMDSQNISVNVTKVTGSQLTAGEETHKSNPDEISKSGLSDNEVLYNSMLALVAGFVNRETYRDITYGSIKIPKETAIQVPVYHLHHNPALWPDHETFDPERFSVDNHDHHPLAWQPFGHGPKNCIGMRFAQLETKMVYLEQFRSTT
ncbi:uncharacterized protein LOC143258538 [Tachypleus tridentatus]|uniref:uncharacterized protein LOC143258538 n=1 Tax=Tachypleus tridentatus TaxID=6853 RepID=UPI003FD2236B